MLKHKSNMKKGFIERIENGNVYVVFDKDDFVILREDDFNGKIEIDYVVLYDNKVLKVLKEDQEIKKKIDDITKEIFTSVNIKRRKKTHK